MIVFLIVLVLLILFGWLLLPLLFGVITGIVSWSVIALFLLAEAFHKIGINITHFFK